MQSEVTLNGCIQDSKKNKTKQKQKLLQMSLPERVKRKQLGDMAKIPPIVADCFFFFLM